MDDLTTIKGIGPATAKKLKAVGIDSIAALALAAVDNIAAVAGAQDEAAVWIEEAAKRVAEGESSVGSIDPLKLRIRVTAPAGPRRRAGFAFGKAPRVLTLADLGDDWPKKMKHLQADPRLSIAPVVDEAED
jgi:hypothetical protein